SEKDESPGEAKLNNVENNVVNEPHVEENGNDSSVHSDHHAGIFGETSLKKPAAETAMASTKTEEKVSKASKNRNKQLTLEIVKENWEIYVNQLKKNVAQMLYFQMQQVVPVQLKNGELFLSCNDAFTKKMVSEHKKEL